VAITDSPQDKHTNNTRERETLKNTLLDLKDYTSLMKFTVHLSMAILD